MLREGRLRGAALDVFDEEPLPLRAALDVPNLVVTPHVAGFSRDYLPRSFEIFADNVRRLERGEALLNEIDRERGSTAPTWTTSGPDGGLPRARAARREESPASGARRRRSPG